MPSQTSVLLLCSSHIPVRDQVAEYCERQGILSSAEFNDNNPDLHFVNTEEKGPQIEEVRHFIADLSLYPYQHPLSIFVIFHIDQASIPAQNALLKSLEEPPAHARILLTATSLEKVLPTIQSRCLIEDVRSQNLGEATLTNTEHLNFLKNVASASYADIFALSEQYKERSDAVSLIGAWMSDAYIQHSQKPSLSSIYTLQKLLAAKDFIEKNVNVRLTLENLCFELQKLNAKNQ